MATAPSYVTGASYTLASNLVTYNNNFTVSDQENSILFVAKYTNSGSITAITYDGAAMTLLGSAGTLQVYYLKSPSVGTNTLSISVSNQYGEYSVTVAQYKDCNIGDPFRGSATTNSSATTITVTSGDDDRVYYAGGHFSTTAPSASSLTQRQAASANNRRCYCGDAAGASPSDTAGWTPTGARLGISLKPKGGFLPIIWL